MLRRTAIAATSLLAAGALLLSACSAGSSPTPSATAAPDPDASVAIRLVLEFRTWQSLVRASGLSRSAAVELAVRAVRCQ